MTKIKVSFVKYDLTKTKNRKRKDMLVDAQNEKAVITQLERIHKDEKVTSIHEIIWDEAQIEESVRREKSQIASMVYGVVNFFDATKGFGFIQADDEHLGELFFHKTACKEGLPSEGDTVEFQVTEGPKGLSAIHVKVIETEY